MWNKIKQHYIKYKSNLVDGLTKFLKNIFIDISKKLCLPQSRQLKDCNLNLNFKWGRNTRKG
jgi:hypothetical protein